MTLRLLIMAAMMMAINSCAYFISKPPFDGQASYEQIKRQCDFGPRNPGSDGHDKCLQYLTDELKKYCDRVDLQNFSYTDKRDTTRKFHLTNIIASINLQPKKKKRIMLCAHWDTRPWADKDPNPANRDKPILGANDGASGVAVLLELARAIKQQPIDVGVDIILFDMEDYGDHDAESHPETLNQYCIGSEYFAKTNKNYFPTYGILLDMIGDKNLDLPIEQNSYNAAKDAVNKVWDAGKRLDKPAFRKTVELSVFDDHIPLIRGGIPCIDIIDFAYPDESNRFHHTLDDTPDKCSAESLQQIGDVLIDVLYRE